jgi:hypothetical protein
MTVVCIEGWEMEVLDGPRLVRMDIYGDMLEFRGIWLSEPERGVVNVYCRRESVFYIEVTQEEILPRRTGPRNKVTYIRGGGEKDPAKDRNHEDPGDR